MSDPRDEVRELLIALAPGLAEAAGDSDTDMTLIQRVADTLRELGADELADELEAGRYRQRLCLAPNPLRDLPACTRGPGHESPHRATWTDWGGTCTSEWQDAAMFREALARRPARPGDATGGDAGQAPDSPA